MPSSFQRLLAAGVLLAGRAYAVDLQTGREAWSLAGASAWPEPAPGGPGAGAAP